MLEGMHWGRSWGNIGFWRNAVHLIGSSCSVLRPGAFWLNPPLPMDEQGNWVGPTRPREDYLMDVDPLS